MDIDDICDEIDDMEEEYEEIECENKKYYIGAYKNIITYSTEDEENKDSNSFISAPEIRDRSTKENMLLFVSKVNVNTFFAYTNEVLSTYLYYNSCIIFEQKPTIEIMQLIVAKDGITYTAVLKTYWIKIIQRTWKKIMEQRKQLQQNMKRNILSVLRTFEYTNRIPQLPTIVGMLSLSNKMSNKNAP
jgi:hypothetical protein